VVEDIAINEPFPRSEDFRVSPAFSRYAKQLQDSLLQASQSGME
jgi:NitT/TauT family transport system ATP-binding protein